MDNLVIQKVEDSEYSTGKYKIYHEPFREIEYTCKFAKSGECLYIYQQGDGNTSHYKSFSASVYFVRNKVTWGNENRYLHQGIEGDNYFYNLKEKFEQLYAQTYKKSDKRFGMLYPNCINRLYNSDTMQTECRLRNKKGIPQDPYHGICYNCPANIGKGSCFDCEFFKYTPSKNKLVTWAKPQREMYFCWRHKIQTESLRVLDSYREKYCIKNE